MPYIGFFNTYKRILCFGLLLSFFSSFGQTFLISLFVPSWLERFPLTNGGFGLLYSVATLTSAALLPFVAQWVDRISLRRYTLAVASGLLLASLLLAVTPNVWILFLGVLGVRLTGQGLLSHATTTTMARSFDRLRGKALSVAGLGFPIGEAILPMTMVGGISLLGWRGAWLAVAGFVLVFLVPFVIWLLDSEPRQERSNDPKENPIYGSLHEGWTRKQVLRDLRFYKLLVPYLVLPFLFTGLFLYQVPLAESKGWAPAWMASGFVAFAAARLVFSLVVGPMIDRHGAVRLFPFLSVPLGGGLLVLWLSPFPWVVYFYLALAGVSQGMAGNVGAAMWAEIYGVKEIGSIKSLASTMAIFSTALSPVLFGFLLDHEIGFGMILVGSMLLIAGCSLFAWWTCGTLKLLPRGA